MNVFVRKTKPYNFILRSSWGILHRGLSNVNNQFKAQQRKINKAGENKKQFQRKPKLYHESINLDRMRSYRLSRIRDELSHKGIGACLFYDPVNIRYALDTTNMSVYATHNFARYCFIALDGPAILFDYMRCEHLSEGLPLIDEIREAITTDYHAVANAREVNIKKWTDEISGLVKQYCGGDNRLAIDVCDYELIHELNKKGVDVVNGKIIADFAKKKKSEDELFCLKASIEVAEKGIKIMKEKLTAGMTEEELWSYLHKTNIEHGGEWIECRLLSSGVRTNPWMSECSNKIIAPKDILAFDTDMVGPYGYCADISRTFVEGGIFSSEQKKLYEIALKQLDHNSSLIKPGLSIKEFVEKSFKLPENCFGNRYSLILHGTGLCDEYPFVPYPEDGNDIDDIFEENQVFSLESYIGEVGGKEGVKLEQQYVIREKGLELLSVYPLETF